VGRETTSTAFGLKWGLTAQAARCFTQSLSALGCFSKILKRRVSLIYRNDDGVDASTLPPIIHPDQRKVGHIFCPNFTVFGRKFPHSMAIESRTLVQQFAWSNRCA